MQKVKIAPDLKALCDNPTDIDCDWERARAQFRALKAVAMAVIRWRDYDSDGDVIVDHEKEVDLLKAVIDASRRLERLSRGAK